MFFTAIYITNHTFYELTSGRLLPKTLIILMMESPRNKCEEEKNNKNPKSVIYANWLCDSLWVKKHQFS